MAEPDTKWIFDTPQDEAEEARLDAQAEAEIDAGKYVTHDRVVAWLKSWGTAKPLPRPRPEPE